MISRITSSYLVLSQEKFGGNFTDPALVRFVIVEEGLGFVQPQQQVTKLAILSHVTPYFPDPLFQHGHLLFDNLPLRDENLELVLGKRKLWIFGLDYPTNMVLTTLDLLPKDLYLFLLIGKKSIHENPLVQPWR